MKPIRILLIEDNDENKLLFTVHLEGEGYEVFAFASGEAALDHVQTMGLPHLALIDLKLPLMSGFDVSARLKMMADVPIIIITGNRETGTVVEALQRYAEDFIVKPLNLDELSARIAVVLARIPTLDYATAPIIHVDARLSIDFAHNRIQVDGVSEVITPTESILLYILIRTPGIAVESRVLIARVWGKQDVVVSADTLRVHIHRLRKKIEVDPQNPAYIVTDRRVGYVFTVRPQSKDASKGESPSAPDSLASEKGGKPRKPRRPKNPQS